MSDTPATLDTPATIDMHKIKTLVACVRLLDKQHAHIMDCTHTEDSAEMASEFVEYINCLTDHRAKLLELSVEEFAELKAGLGKKDE